MKKLISLLLVLVLALGCLAGCAGDEAAASDGGGSADGNVVKIGVFEPASGDNGAGGKQETLGIQYGQAVQPTVEIGGTEYTVELVYADNQSSNDKAISAAQTLVSEGVSVVLGSYGSGVSIAASDVFGDNGIPAIGVTCTNPQVTEGNEHYFRVCFIESFQGPVLANFAKSLGATKAYCLAKQGDDYSVGLCNYFMDAFGKDSCVYETFPEGTSDFSSYVTNAKNQGCDVFFSPTSTEAAALIIDQASTQDLGMPMLAGDTWDSNVITAAAQGKDNIELYVTTFYQEGGDPEFDEAFREWINGDETNLANNGGNDMVSGLSVMGYDAYFVALEALKLAGSTDPADVMTALWDVSYDGVTGHIEFDEIGDAIRNEAYVKECNTETGAWDFVAVQGIE